MLQAWREHAMHRRELAVRWDEALLGGLADFLAAADRALRDLQHWRRARDASAADTGDLATAALASYEALHDKSHLISILAGDRDDPLREAARRMRKTLLPLSEEARGWRTLEDLTLLQLVHEHREARDTLILRAQDRLKGARVRPSPRAD